MPSKLGRGLLIFVLLVIAVVSWQWIDERDTETTTTTDTIDMAATQSDYYLENFEIKNISNKSRQPAAGSHTAGPAIEYSAAMPADRQLNIIGKSLSHHYIERYSVIDSPVIRLRNTDNGLWNARASSGIISANFDVLDLQGNVELTRSRLPVGAKADTRVVDSQVDPKTNSQIRVDTNSLSIDTTNRTITSTEPVQVEGDGWVYNAGAMAAEIDSGTLSFSSGVEAQFESPNQR